MKSIEKLQATVLDATPEGQDRWVELDNALGLGRYAEQARKAASETEQARSRPAGDDSNLRGMRIVTPPLPLDALARLPQESAFLLQCITSMVTNIDGYGWDLEYVGPEEEKPDPKADAKPDPQVDAKPDPTSKPPTGDVAVKAVEKPEAVGKPKAAAKPKTPSKGPDSPEALAEAIRLRTFFLTCNDRESLESLRRKMRMDSEATGNGYWEILRDGDGTGDPAMIEHMPSYTMRLTPLDREPTEVETTMIGPDHTPITRTVARRFRRYVQIQEGRFCYFKELGDPRRISAFDGRDLDTLGVVAKKFETLPNAGPIASGIGGASGAPGIDPMDEATEVLHFTNVYLPDSPYGGTKYMGNIPSIRGSRYTELVNLQFFRRNAIPAMVVLVGGGALTPESKEQVKEYFREEYSGLVNLQRVLVIEAVPSTASVDAQRSTMTLDMQPLQGQQQADGRFLDYDERCREKIMSSWRLPAIYLGYSKDVNYASAQTARITAEEQIFQPERNAFDEIINLRLLRPLGATYWRFFSLGPEIADVATFTAAMQAFSAMGALTPNQSIELMNELLGTTAQPIVEAWGDYPFPMVMAFATQGQLEGVDDIEKEPPPAPPNPFGGPGGGNSFGGPGGPGGGNPFGKAAGPTPDVPVQGAKTRPEKLTPGGGGAQAAGAASGLAMATKSDELDPEAFARYVVKTQQDVMHGIATIQQLISRKADLSVGDLGPGGLLSTAQGRRMRRTRRR